MNRFLTTLKTEKIGYGTDRRALFRLLRDLVYYSDKYGLIIVPAGFITNFASVPRLPVVFLVAGGRAEEEATLHDFGYTVRNRPRADYDALFLESMRALKPYKDGLHKQTPSWLSGAMYQAVHLFGGSSYEAETTITQPEHIVKMIQPAVADLVDA